MKKEKRMPMRIIITILCLLLIGCTAVGDQAVSKNNIEPTKEPFVTEVVKSGEHYYHSPDSNNKIVRKFFGEDSGDLLLVDIYLNNQKIDSNISRLKLGDDNNYAEAIWISNDKVIICGEYILDINTMTKQNIDSSKVTQESVKIINYAISPLKDSIAYLVAGDNVVNVFLYNIKDKSWNLVCQNPSEGTDTSWYDYNISWYSQNELYFDTYYYTICSYNLSEKRKNTFLKGVSLISISSNNKNVAVYNEDSTTTKIIDINNKEIVLEFKGKIWCWWSIDSICYLKNDEFTIFNLENVKNMASHSIGLIKAEDIYEVANRENVLYLYLKVKE